jgi:hypothetical protein
MLRTNGNLLNCSIAFLQGELEKLAANTEMLRANAGIAQSVQNEIEKEYNAAIVVEDTAAAAMKDSQAHLDTAHVAVEKSKSQLIAARDVTEARLAEIQASVDVQQQLETALTAMENSSSDDS